MNRRGCQAGSPHNRDVHIKKKHLLWAEWLREKLLAPVPHRHVVLTMPRLLRPLFRRRRELLGELSQAGAEAVAQATRGGLAEDVRPGIVVSIATAGDLLQWHPEMWMEGIRAYFKGEVVVSKDLMAL